MFGKSGNEIWIRVARAISTLGGLIGILLMARSLSISGSLCPWCAAFHLLTILQGVVLSGQSSPHWKASAVAGWLAAGVILGATGVYAGIRVIESLSFTNQLIKNIDTTAMIRGAVPLAASRKIPRESPRYVMFVDFSCPACQDAMRKVAMSRSARLVWLRFVEPHTNSSGKVANLLQSAWPSPCYPALIKTAIEVPENLRLIEQAAAPCALRSQNEQVGPSDWTSGLEIRVTPTFFDLKGGKVKGITLRDVLTNP